MGRARVILHIDRQYHDRFLQTKRLAMFGKIHSIITARGGEVVLAPRPKGRLSVSEAQGDGDLHIVESGGARGVGWLNSSIAYLTGFWHLDDKGILSGAEMAARGDLVPLPRRMRQRPPRSLVIFARALKTNAARAISNPKPPPPCRKAALRFFCKAARPNAMASISLSGQK